MDTLLKASENFKQQDDFDEKTFLEFMKQVAIWDYFGLSKNDYFALPETEKRVKISQYYGDMKSKGAGESLRVIGKCLFFYSTSNLTLIKW